jgi:hypothetical protein
MCYLSTKDVKLHCVPKSLKRLLGTSRAAGGYGCFYKHQDVKSRSKPETVETRGVLKESELAEFGGARMTDPIIRRVMRDYNVNFDQLRGARDQMVLASVIPSFDGRGTGKRKRDNAANVVKVADGIKFKKQKYHVALDSKYISLAFSWTQELRNLLADTSALRRFQMLEPAGVILNKISQAGLVNQDLAMAATGAAKPSHLWRALCGGGLSNDEAEVVNQAWKLEQEGRKAMAMYVFSGGPRGSFWKEDEPMSGEVASLVVTFARIKWVGAGAPNMTTQNRETMKEDVIGELSVSELSRFMWLNLKSQLSSIIY